MTTEPPTPTEGTREGAHEVREPVAQPTPHTYECSECIDPTPALEVHALGEGMIVAYCAGCAPTWRPFAHVVLEAPLAHALQITLREE